MVKERTLEKNGNNETRLLECMERAQGGEELTIGFLGGSITQGSLASQHENCYAYQVFLWWKNTFPQAEFHYVNAGIGGTSSHFGVARVETDLLIYQPDFVLIDFSVNDESDTFFQETYEGLVRKILTWASQPALLLLNNVFYDSGINAQFYHNAVGEHYGIPHISILDTVYQKMLSGEYARKEITPDGLHPNDRGHKLVAHEIISFLEKVRKECFSSKIKSEDEKRKKSRKLRETYALPQPLTENAYENAKRLTIYEIFPVLKGFYVDTARKEGYSDYFKNGWIGKHVGDRIIFTIKASCIAVQYRKTICRPALSARLVLDGDEEHSVFLDGNFEENWGDCLYLEPILHHGKNKLHTVEICLVEGKGQVLQDVGQNGEFENSETEHRMLDFRGNYGKSEYRKANKMDENNGAMEPFYLMSLIVV